MRYKKHKNKIRAAIIVILLAAAVFTYYFRITVPIIKGAAEESLKADAVTTINAANKKLQKLQAFYGALFEFIKNDDGDIVLIRSNSALINQINMLASLEIQEALNGMRNKKLSVRAGAFTGSSVLADKGGEVQLKITSVGKCRTQFISKFYKAGINNTLHRVFIQLDVDMEVLVPWQAQKVAVEYQIILAENVIVGRVPSTYLDSGFNADYLDLLPD